jgi:hypothetical protein
MSDRRIVFRSLLLAVLLAAGSDAASAQDIIAPLPYPVRNHEEWYRMQYGASLEEWTAKLGPDYRNRNSGPACVVMILHYKKRAWIKSDYGSFSDRHYPRIHADSRWTFCRANTEKGYSGGFADDDQADVSAEELADVLANEDVPTVVHSGMGEITIERVADIIRQANLAVCRVEPSAYFKDERPGESRWVVVYGVTARGVIMHDPGRNEGRSLTVPRGAFLEAVRTARGEGAPVMIECLTMVGSYGEGWRADGRSRPFVEAFRKHEKRIGRPDNPGGTFCVHPIAGCIVQDFKQDLDKPHYGKTGSSMLFFDPDRLRAYWLKGDFYEKYIDVWGFDNLGPAVTDEYAAAAGTRQDFQNGWIEREGDEVVARDAKGAVIPKAKR